jgi:hypothetical protein
VVTNDDVTGRENAVIGCRMQPVLSKAVGGNFGWMRYGNVIAVKLPRLAN